MQPMFTIRPDEAHRPTTRGGAPITDRVQQAYAKVERMLEAPEQVPVLFGDPESPYLRLDPFFMKPVGDRETQEALKAAIGAIDAVLEDLVLEPGGIYFIDNYQGVHGRKPFRARFDGSDRWLKRINIARDLRKSRDVRECASSRLLF
jgi:hypothetical protein